MNYLFRDVDNCLIYLDDILIYSKTKEDHYNTLKTVFEIISKNNISVNFEKSKLVKDNVEFLGHTITKDGIIPNISKLDDIKYDNVKTKRQLQRVIGVINWYRPFIKDISSKMHNIYELLKTKNQRVKWTDKNKQIIKSIIEEIKKKPMLHHPNLNLPFILQCDASKFGIGSVLMQNNKIIALYSSKYSTQENNYSIVERETLSIIKSLIHFKPLIYNSKIYILTDNKNLTFNGPLTKRIERWKLTLEEYDYELSHIDGKQNLYADTLSILCKLKCVNENNTDYRLKFPYKAVKDIKLHYCTKLSNESKDNENAVTEDKLKDLLKNIHENLIHPGINKMNWIVKHYFKISKTKKLINNICRECKKCNSEKEYRQMNGITINKPIISKINECVAIDIKVPIKSRHFKTTSKIKYFYILAIADLFSRYTEISIINDIKSKTITSNFKKVWIRQHKPPQKCLTDNGRQFNSISFNKLTEEFNIKHIKSAPYNPTGNAIIERINKEIGVVLRLSRGATFSELKRCIWRRLNLNVNISTGYPPYEVFYKKPIFNNVPNDIKINESEIVNKNKMNTKKTNELIKRKRKPITYVRGDYVYLRNFSADKVEPKWLGPYQVIRISSGGNNVYIDKGNKISRASINNIRIFRRGEDVASISPATTDETDTIEQSEQSDQSDESAESDESDESGESGESGESDEGDESDESDESIKVMKVN
ncbi:Transposon Tf2-9 polyprotein [Dictyocoela muelleri]|nr:Transposon Tf2-9 polyprotein [Dictyocoela muelleri]